MKASHTDEARGEQFIQLLLSNRRRLYGLAITLVPRAADADDVLQEASTRMWQKFSTFTPGTDFVAWGWAFVRFAALELHKKQKRDARVAFSDELIAKLAERVASLNPEADRRQDALKRCLQKLPEESRRMIELRYSPGQNCRSVAQRFGKSVHTVYKSLGRIHDALLRCTQRVLAEASE